MTAFIILFAIAAVTLIAFTAFVMYKTGILPSFSDSYYSLQRKKPFYKYLFQICLVVTSFSLTPVMLQFTPEWCQFLAFFTTAPIAFVGLAPRFRIGNNGKPEFEIERSVHMKAAKVSGIASSLWVIAVSVSINLLLLITIPACGIIAYALYMKHGNKIWWAEMAAFAWTLSTTALILF